VTGVAWTIGTVICLPDPCWAFAPVLGALYSVGVGVALNVTWATPLITVAGSFSTDPTSTAPSAIAAIAP
jgi:hypothetical protein